MGGRGASSASKKGASGTLAGGVSDDAIRQYTGGGYVFIRSAAGYDNCTFDQQDIIYAREFEREIGKTSKPIDVTRTINASAVPHVGDNVTFSMQSASKRKDWADAVIRGNEPGMKFIPEQPLIAYKISGLTHYADISDKSLYQSQKEVVFSGAYRVKSINSRTVDTGVRNPATRKEKLETIEEYAKRNNLPIRHFISKAGVEMVQAGTGGKGTKTYRKGVLVRTGEDIYQNYQRILYEVTLEKQ